MPEVTEPFASLVFVFAIDFGSVEGVDTVANIHRLAKEVPATATSVTQDSYFVKAKCGCKQSGSKYHRALRSIDSILTL